MKRGYPDGEDGQGLGYVLVIGSVLLILLVAIVDILRKEMNWMVSGNKKNFLLHAADAGIDRAKYALQQGSNWNDIPKYVIPGYNQDAKYTDTPGVFYTLKVEEGNMTPHVQIGNLKMERTVTVCATYTPTGERKKVVALLLQSTINSAIFSGGQIAIGGSADIRWGPVVSYSTASNSIQVNTCDHPIYMSKGGITGCPGLQDNPTPQAGKYYNSYGTDEEIGAPPVIPLDQWRSIAKAQGTYQGGGNVCYTPNENILGNMDDDTVVFWDTCDGTDYDPKTDSPCSGSCHAGSGGHGVDVKITGSWGGKGILVVMGDLTTAGTNAMPTTLVPPTDCYPKFESNAANCTGYPKNVSVLWDGFMYVAGSLSSKGNKDVYGTVYAYSTAGITGNFTVWYKSNNSSLGYLGKSIMTELWMERKEETGDVFP